jgi:XTP/dITP diphosphohydrolase
VLALARRNQALAVFSAACEGQILEVRRGSGGFGYDPLFFFPPLNKTMAELEVSEKNCYSHRGQAFVRLLAHLKQSPPVL